jgi:hypothetical protein
MVLTLFMLEVGLYDVLAGVIVCVVIGRIADGDGRSPVVWGGIALALCVASLAIPLPIYRMLIAGVVAVGTLFVYNLARTFPR